MAEVASAFVSLMPSAKGFGTSMNRQIGPQINSSAKTAGSRFGKVFAYSSMSPLKAIGAAAVGLFAVQKVKDFFGSAISEARESQKVSAITAQVIKSTGGAANISANQVGRLATQISNMTGIDDEAIQSGSNLLLTFKNIRNEAGAGNDIFNQTTRIMTDMATAMGTEPKAAAIQLGKALNDPVKGITALTRVGVTFTDQQKKTIAALVDGGNTIGAQKIILKELNSEFGGTAAAAATAGEKFHTTFANFQEAIGTALLPYLDKLLAKGTVFIGFLMSDVPSAFASFKAAIEPVTSAISDLINNHLTVFNTVLSALAGGGIASIIALIGGSLIAVLATLATFLASPIVLIGALAGAAIYAYTQFASFRTLVQQVIAWFQTSFIPAFMQAVAAVQLFATQLYARIAPLLPQVQQIFSQIVSTVKSYLTLAAAEVRVAVAVIQFVWQHFGQTMLDFAQRTFQNILTAIKGALNIIQGVIKLVTSLIKGDWSGAWDAIKQIARGAWQIIGAVVKQGIAQLQAVFGILKTALPIIAEKAWDLVKAAFVAGIRLAVHQAQSLPGQVVAVIRGGVALMFGVGEDLIRGLIGGIKAAASAVASAAVDVVKGAIGAAKNALGIHSPSRVFHEIGGFSMQGLVNGIVAGAPAAINAAEDAARKVQAVVLDQLTSMRDKAKGVVDGLQSDFKSLRDSVASAFTGNLFQAGNAHSFLVDLVNTKGTLKKLSEAFKKLLKWGLDPSFLSSLFQSGNGGLILDLAGGSRLDARTASSVFNDIGSLSNSLGGQVATADIGPELRSQTRELREIKQAISALPAKFGQEINKSVSHGQKKGKK